MNEAEQRLIEKGYNKDAISETIVMHFMPSEKTALKLMAIEKRQPLKTMTHNILMEALHEYQNREQSNG